MFEIHPLDARGLGAAGQVDVEPGQIEVGRPRNRVRGGADGDRVTVLRMEIASRG
jgi:hypothetical protein